MEDDSPVFYMDFLGIFGKGSRAHDHNALMVVKGVSVSKAAGMVRHRHNALMVVVGVPPCGSTGSKLLSGAEAPARALAQP